MYFASYAKRLDEIQRKQKDRPRQSAYKDKNGTKHPASLIKLLSYEVDEQIHGEPSPITAYKLDERAQAVNPFLSSLFELTYQENRKRRDETK